MEFKRKGRFGREIISSVQNVFSTGSQTTVGWEVTERQEAGNGKPPLLPH